MSGRGDIQRRRLFEQGVRAAARAVFNVPSGCYICPLCPPGRAFTSAALEGDLLDLDHVPPASTGGELIVLTCKNCNSTAGHEVDVHVFKRDQVFNFAQGNMTRELRNVVLEIEGLELDSRLIASGDSVKVVGPPSKHMRPGLEAALGAALGRMGGAEQHGGFEMRLRFPEYDSWLAAVGRLRSGYLAAFAALGYRYAFRRDLRPVREQLREPSARLLRRFTLTDPGQPPRLRRIGLVEEPEQFRGILVQLGWDFVRLPGLRRDDDFFDRLSAESDQNDGRRVSFAWQEIPWPKEPTFALDFS